MIYDYLLVEKIKAIAINVVRDLEERKNNVGAVKPT